MLARTADGSTIIVAERLVIREIEMEKRAAAKRCSRIVTGVLVPIALLSLKIALPASPSLAADRPNIIYIMTDDLGYGDLGCYGQKVVQTPNLDRMAAEGMRFTDHYAGHTVCRPSRLVLWTGQHVGHTGLTGNRPRSLTGMEMTVAKQLKQAGYATGGVGKWALGNVDDPSEVDNPGHPNHNGFDYWFGYLRSPVCGRRSDTVRRGAQEPTASPTCRHCLASPANSSSTSTCTGPAWKERQRLAFEWENGSSSSIVRNRSAKATAPAMPKQQAIGGCTI